MVQIIHISSHGEILKHISGDILFEICKYGEMVILTFVSPLFNVPLRKWGPSPLIDSISCWIFRVCISCLWEVAHWLSNCPMRNYNALLCHIPPLLPIDTFLPYLPSTTANIGGVHPLLWPPCYFYFSLFIYCKLIILSLCYCNTYNFH